jgi:hypothetical protein
MGYRGKLAEQQQARQLRRTGLPLAEIALRVGVAKSSVSLWVRDVEFAPVRSPPRGRRRDPNALQRRRQAEIDRLLVEGRGPYRPSVGARVPGRRRGPVRGGGHETGRRSPLRESRPAHDLFLLLLVTAVLRDRRVPAPGTPLSARGTGSGGQRLLLVGADGDSGVTVGKPYRAVPDPSIRRAKHVHGCVTVSYSCSATHRCVMGLVNALLSGTALPG